MTSAEFTQKFLMHRNFAEFEFVTDGINNLSPQKIIGLASKYRSRTSQYCLLFQICITRVNKDK